jgi:hypothetical protein
MAKEPNARPAKRVETILRRAAPANSLQPPPPSSPLKAMLLRSHLRPNALLFPPPKPDTLMFGYFYV